MKKLLSLLLPLALALSLAACGEKSADEAANCAKSATARAASVTISDWHSPS